jgi:WD40 repeat protein
VPKYKGVIDSKGPVSSIYAPELSNNFTIVTAAGDVYFMNAYGSVLWQFCINDKLNSVSMSRDGRIIFAGSSDNKVLCLHSEQKVLFNYELKSPVICTDISEDGKYFAVGCSDGYIYVLDSSGNTVFYDRPLSCVSEIYLNDGAEQILTLSDSNLISMYKICERKTLEDKSKDFAGFIELDSNINFKTGNAGGLNNKSNDDFEKFIEL